MKYFFLVLISLLCWSAGSQAQSPEIAFNQAANLFIAGQNQQALQSVNAALRRHPKDASLKTLKEKLEQEQKEQQQQQQQNQNKEEEQQQQQQKDGKSGEEQEEQQEQEGKEKEQQEQEGEQKEQENKESKEQQEQQKKEGQEPQPGQSETERRLQEMDISPEKARMILEAMKSNEVQYLQQKKRKASKRSNNGKPDW